MDALGDALMIDFAIVERNIVDNDEDDERMRDSCERKALRAACGVCC